LILSFFYELPIREVTSFDRINPRLFDVATLLGLVFIMPGVRRGSPVPRLFEWWFAIVVWFVFCAMLWALAWFPWQEAGRFSLFYGARYLQGLLVIYLALRIPLSPRQKRCLHYAVVAGGVFVALYAIPEYVHRGVVRQIAGGKVVNLMPGTLLGPLGTTYSHISGVSALAFAMSLALLVGSRARRGQWLLLAIALLVAWPGLVCGSRSGLLALGFVFFVALVYIPRLRTKMIKVGIVAVLLVGLLDIQMPSLKDIMSLSRTIDRLMSIEESGTHDTIMERIGVGSGNIQGYTLDIYEWQSWRLPIFGGGFYAVPVLRDGRLRYRVGYGIHNGYLFPFEQGGAVAFMLFIGFLVVCFKSLCRMKRSLIPEDAAFATGIWLFFLPLLVSTWFGAPTWQGEGMVNFSTCVLLMLMLACRGTGARTTTIDGCIVKSDPQGRSGLSGMQADG
jgi:membrane-associated phospholipid phosphatase